MKILILTLALVAVFIAASQQSTAIGAVQTSSAVFNTTAAIGGGNASTTENSVLSTVGEWALGNASMGSGYVLVGFYYTFNTSFNGSVNISEPVICVSTWECTGWVENGSYDYRTCTDTSACAAPQSPEQPEVVRVGFATGVIILIPFMVASILMAGAFLIRSDESTRYFRHVLMMLSLGMVIPGIGFAFAALNDTPSANVVESNLTDFLWIIGIIDFFIVGSYVFYLLYLHVRNLRKNKVVRMGYENYGNGKY